MGSQMRLYNSHSTIISTWKLAPSPRLFTRSLSVSASRWKSKQDIDAIFGRQASNNMARYKGLGGTGMQQLSAADMELLSSNVVMPPTLSPDAPGYHFHVYTHKHNSHITLTRPNREPVISVSCGNLGFRKAGRGTYDSAFQLAAYVLNKMKEDQKLLKDITKMDLVLRGHGVGREAILKAILGSEGHGIRDKIQKVVDSTRIKFGGTRSKGRRRL